MEEQKNQNSNLNLMVNFQFYSTSSSNTIILMGFYHFPLSLKEICIIKDENIFHFENLKVD